MSKKQTTHINLVGGATSVSPSRRRKDVVKPKSRGANKAGTIKDRDTGRGAR